MRILEKFDGQILKVFSICLRDIWLPLAVYPEVVHALQINISSLELNQVRLKRVEALGDLCNGVWIG